MARGHRASVGARARTRARPPVSAAGHCPAAREGVARASPATIRRLRSGDGETTPARPASGRVASSQHRPLAMRSGGQWVPRLALAAAAAAVVLLRLAWGSAGGGGGAGVGVGRGVGAVIVTFEGETLDSEHGLLSARRLERVGMASGGEAQRAREGGAGGVVRSGATERIRADALDHDDHTGRCAAGGIGVSDREPDRGRCRARPRGGRSVREDNLVSVAIAAGGHGRLAGREHRGGHGEHGDGDSFHGHVGTFVLARTVPRAQANPGWPKRPSGGGDLWRLPADGASPLRFASTHEDHP